MDPKICASRSVGLSRHNGSHLRSAVSLIGTIIAWLFLWFYLRRSFDFPLFDAFASISRTSLYAGFALLIGIVACGFAAAQHYIVPLLRRSSVVICSGIIGSLTLVLLDVIAQIGLLEGALIVLVGSCLLITALCVCTVFFAWILELQRQIRCFGIEKIILAISAAFCVAFFISSFADMGTTFETLCITVGLGIAGACYCIVRHLHIPDIPAIRFASSPMERQLLPWLIVLTLYYFIAGGLGYTYLFNEGPATVSPRALDISTYISLGLVALFSLYMIRLPIRRGYTLFMSTSLFILLEFLTLFGISFAASQGTEFTYILVRSVRRLSWILAFLTVLALVHRYGLPPLRTVTFFFLLPTICSRVIQMATASALAGIDMSGLLYTVLATAGFTVMICLVICYLLSIGGGSMRHMPVDTSIDHEEDIEETYCARAPIPAPTQADMHNRRAICEMLGSQYGLTSREIDVLYLFSQGMSAHHAAVSLSLSVSTINTHSMMLYRKLDVHTKQEIIDLIHEHEDPAVP